MIGVIVAVSPEGVIGVDNRVPWRHPGDMRRFKRVTMGATVVMGRKTFESMGKALAGRRNVVVTRGAIDVPGVESVRSVDEALARAREHGEDVWFIGGAEIYREGMKHADVLDVTYVPDHVDAPGAVRFPPIDESVFEPGAMVDHEDETGLKRRIWTRRGR